MASTVSKKRSRTTRRQAPRRIGDMTQEELRNLITEIVDSRLAGRETPSPVREDFDWIKEAREIRSRAPVGRDSTPLLHRLREERARR
ncbi:MAG: hypothetical protein M1570_01710 [Chloroflexi bacterium]|nr:hypothetical protein [Chloroflexota bacterium]